MTHGTDTAPHRVVPALVVLPFGVDRGDHDYTERYGNRYFAVGLPDGREVFLMADRLDVTDTGALVVWRETQPVPGDDGKREPVDREMTLGFAPGAWVTFYAASLLDGGPVAVSALTRPGAGMDGLERVLARHTAQAPWEDDEPW